MDRLTGCRPISNGAWQWVWLTKAAGRRRYAMAKLKTNSRGENNGRCPMVQEIMAQQRDDAVARQCRPAVSNRIRQAFTISAETIGNGAQILTKAAAAHPNVV